MLWPIARGKTYGEKEKKQRKEIFFGQSLKSSWLFVIGCLWWFDFRNLKHL